MKIRRLRWQMLCSRPIVNLLLVSTLINNVSYWYSPKNNCLMQFARFRQVGDICVQCTIA